MSSNLTEDSLVDAVWENFKEKMRTLYLDQNLSLKAIMKEMAAAPYHFQATKAQYEFRFKKWNFHKNWTKNEWEAVAHKIRKRKRYDKDSEVYRNGIFINPKKVRRETARYGSLQTTSEIYRQQSPQTPEGVLVCTPPPRVSSPFSLGSMSPFHLTSPCSSDWVSMDCISSHVLPFFQFDLAFNLPEILFSSTLGSKGIVSSLLRSSLHFSLLSHFKEICVHGKSGSVAKGIRTLIPESSFATVHASAGMTLLADSNLSLTDFLKFTVFLISNNFFDISEGFEERYDWLRFYINSGLLDHLLSIGGPTVEALAEKLFQLSVHASDVGTVKKLMSWGVDPNWQICGMIMGEPRTPLQVACSMRNFELARALVDGGAKLDLMKEMKESLWRTLEFGCPLSRRHIYSDLVDIDFVRLLLEAGADVNPENETSPLFHAAGSGHVELVRLLISVGADVNFMNDETGTTPILNAVRCLRTVRDEDRIEIVRSLIRAGADLNVRNSHRYGNHSLLSSALHCDSFGLIQLLLESGAVPEQPDLGEAAKSCNLNIVRLLLNAGLKVTEEVMQAAVENQFPQVLFYLLNSAKTSLRVHGSRIAIIHAIKYGKYDLFRELNDYTVGFRDQLYLKKSIRAVALRGDICMLRLLLEDNLGYRKSVMKYLHHALIPSIEKDHENLTELLLELGADVNYKTLSSESLSQNHYTSALEAAIHKKNLHLVRKLLAAGANLNTLILSGEFGMWNSVLPAAVDWGYYPLIQEMIEAGADVNAPASNGKISLSTAIEKRDRDTVQLLIGAGADVNNPEAIRQDCTALKSAARNNDQVMVKYLLDLGAEPDEMSLTEAVSGSINLVKMILQARLHRYGMFSNGYGRIALRNAIDSNKLETVEELLAIGLSANQSISREVSCIFNNAVFGTRIDNKKLISAGKYGSGHENLPSKESILGTAIRRDESKDFSIVRMLLRYGANPDGTVHGVPSTDTLGLLAAIDRNSDRLVKILIEAGAKVNPNPALKTLKTPLQFAVLKGNMDIVNLLIDHGADVNAPPCDDHGATALQYAAILGYVKIAQILLENGAEIDAAPAMHGGRTALEGAAEHGRIDMVQFLLNSGAQTVGRGEEQFERAKKLAKRNNHHIVCSLMEKFNAGTFSWPGEQDLILSSLE